MNTSKTAAQSGSSPSPLFGVWQPIATAPVGVFLIWLPSTELPWPASRHSEESEVFSNSHGVVNRESDKWSPRASHWMPLPAPPNTKLSHEEGGKEQL